MSHRPFVPSSDPPVLIGTYLYLCRLDALCYLDERSATNDYCDMHGGELDIVEDHRHEQGNAPFLIQGRRNWCQAAGSAEPDAPWANPKLWRSTSVRLPDAATFQYGYQGFRNREVDVLMMGTSTLTIEEVNDKNEVVLMSGPFDYHMAPALGTLDPFARIGRQKVATLMAGRVGVVEMRRI